MLGIKHILYICSQLGVRFLADSNIWNVNGTPNIRTVKHMLRVLRQLASDNVLAQPSVHLFNWVNTNQISSTKFSIFRSMAT